MRLNAKITSLLVTSAVVAGLSTGLVALGIFASFRDATVTLSSQSLQQEMERTLQQGVANEKLRISSLVSTLASDVRRLSGSGNARSFLKLKTGNHPRLTDQASRQTDAVLEGLQNVLILAQQSLRKTVEHDLAVAHDRLISIGLLDRSGSATTWTVINQLTTASREVVLPRLRLDEEELPVNDNPEIPVPVVDEVTRLTGALCTIFQRIDDSGDLVRVATSVRTTAGKRAIGTAIPAVNPDGKPNPVATAIAKGEIFIGRAKVVDQWCQTAYRPLLDADKKVIGAIFVGIPERSLDVLSLFTQTRFGTTGFCWVVDGEGTIVAHPQASLVGTPAAKLVATLVNPLAGRSDKDRKVERLSMDGKDSFLGTSAFNSWNWLICTTVDTSEVITTVTAAMKEGLEREMLALADSASFVQDGKKLPLYPQVRLLDAQGMELVKVQDRELVDTLIDRSSTAWFKAAAAAETKICFAPIETSTNTKRPELRAIIPVRLEGQFLGAAVINLDWQATQEICKSIRYGNSGYFYILDPAGTLVTHPKFSLRDPVNICDPKFGALAKLAKERMLTGATGLDRYEFEGVDKFAAFAPLPIGDQNYCLAVTAPVQEFMGLIHEVSAQAQTRSVAARWQIGWTMLVVVLIAGLAGWFFSRRLVKPIRTVTSALGRMAQGVPAGDLAVRSRDEIGAIADACRSMADTSQHYAEAAQAIARGDLTVQIPLASEQDAVGRAMQIMTANLRDLAGRITGESTMLAQSAEALAAVSTGLVKDTRGTREKAETVASATEELSTTVTGLAGHAQTMSKTTQAIASAVQELSTAITGIAGQAARGAEITAQAKTLTDEARTTMAKLDESAKTIGSVSELIKRIAEQTNLLALNATIEAASAGEAGRGFAVVASEIKTLAHQSSSAAEDIAGRINGVQQGSHAVRDLIGKVAGVIEELNQTSSLTSQAVARQTQAAETVTSNLAQAREMVAGVATAAAESAAGTKDIAASIQGVNAAAAGLAKASDTVDGAAKELASIAGRLSGILGGFKLN